MKIIHIYFYVFCTVYLILKYYNYFIRNTKIEAPIANQPPTINSNQQITDVEIQKKLSVVMEKNTKIENPTKSDDGEVIIDFKFYCIFDIFFMIKIKNKKIIS